MLLEYSATGPFVPLFTVQNVLVAASQTPVPLAFVARMAYFPALFWKNTCASQSLRLLEASVLMCPELNVTLPPKQPVIKHLPTAKQVLEMIRSEEDFATLPVMFLTAKSDAKSVLDVKSLNPQGYLLKTMGPKEIVKAVDEFLANIEIQNRQKKLKL